MLDLATHHSMPKQRILLLLALEVIASDFERLETDTTMEEEQAAKEYKKSAAARAGRKRR